jgi:hypothetical protein
VPTDLRFFQREFLKLRELYAQGKVSIEQLWGYDMGWQPCDWKSPDVWLWVKIDALVHLTPQIAVVIDYKTGKKTGNEVPHSEQVALYGLATMLRYPELEQVHVELWYLDQDDITHGRYTRETAMRQMAKFNKRALAMTECEKFPPNANVYTCRYCMYGAKGSQVCPTGL